MRERGKHGRGRIVGQARDRSRVSRSVAIALWGGGGGGGGVAIVLPPPPPPPNTTTTTIAAMAAMAIAATTIAVADALTTSTISMIWY